MSRTPARMIASVALPCLLPLSQTILPSAIPFAVAFSSATPNSLQRRHGFRHPPFATVDAFPTALRSKKDGAPPPTKEDKFSFLQRIESTKSGIIGLLVGGIALAPFSFFHSVLFPSDNIQNRLAQWEYDTDTGSLMGALFAIVYRYCVREDDDNEMLNMGVIGAFVLVRTLGRVTVPSYCTAVPLDCGDPIGYFDWSMITQVAFNGLESVALFGGVAAAMDWSFDRGILSKFR